MDKESDVFVIGYPVDATYLGQPFPFHTQAMAARIICERAGCNMKTFDYEGIVDAAPRPGETEGKRNHVWSALRAATH